MAGKDAPFASRIQRAHIWICGRVGHEKYRITARELISKPARFLKSCGEMAPKIKQFMLQKNRRQILMPEPEGVAYV